MLTILSFLFPIDNRYPGLRCGSYPPLRLASPLLLDLIGFPPDSRFLDIRLSDVPSYAYTFRFENNDWSEGYAQGPEIQVRSRFSIGLPARAHLSILTRVSIFWHH